MIFLSIFSLQLLVQPRPSRRDFSFSFSRSAVVRYFSGLLFVLRFIGCLLLTHVCALYVPPPS